MELNQAQENYQHRKFDFVLSRQITVTKLKVSMTTGHINKLIIFPLEVPTGMLLPLASCYNDSMVLQIFVP